MKKKIFTALVMSGCLALSMVTAYASSDTATHGEMNVDNLLNNKVAAIQQTLNATRTSAGGGEFWVEWFTKNGFQAFSSNYEHATKTHKSTASSSNDSDTSGWVSPNTLAYSWVYSTMWGNTANWDTK